MQVSERALENAADELAGLLRNLDDLDADGFERLAERLRDIADTLTTQAHYADDEAAERREEEEGRCDDCGGMVCTNCGLCHGCEGEESGLTCH